MTAQQNVLAVAAMYEVLNSHDLSGLAPHLAESVELNSTAFGLTINGRDGVRQFLEGFITAFPDFVLTVQRQLAGEDWVVNEVTWSGTHSGPLATPTGVIPPTGRRAEQVPMCELFRFEGGKVVQLVNYHDVATWMRQLGLI